MTQLKIFTVDDDIFYLNIFAQHLRNLGIKDVTAFENGTDCLNKLHYMPDIIFLDYNMDTLSGFEVLKKIKRFDPNIYVVMVSSQEEIKPAIDALKHGAFDYIQKGETEEVNIHKVIQRIIDIKKLLKKPKSGMFKGLLQIF